MDGFFAFVRNGGDRDYVQQPSAQPTLRVQFDKSRYTYLYHGNTRDGSQCEPIFMGDGAFHVFRPKIVGQVPPPLPATVTGNALFNVWGCAAVWRSDFNQICDFNQACAAV